MAALTSAWSVRGQGRRAGDAQPQPAQAQRPDPMTDQSVVHGGHAEEQSGPLGPGRCVGHGRRGRSREGARPTPRPAGCRRRRRPARGHGRWAGSGPGGRPAPTRQADPHRLRPGQQVPVTQHRSLGRRRGPRGETDQGGVAGGGGVERSRLGVGEVHLDPEHHDGSHRGRWGPVALNRRSLDDGGRRRLTSVAMWASLLARVPAGLAGTTTIPARKCPHMGHRTDRTDDEVDQSHPVPRDCRPAPAQAGRPPAGVPGDQAPRPSTTGPLLPLHRRAGEVAFPTVAAHAFAGASPPPPDRAAVSVGALHGRCSRHGRMTASRHGRTRRVARLLLRPPGRSRRSPGADRPLRAHLRTVGMGTGTPWVPVLAEIRPRGGPQIVADRRSGSATPEGGRSRRES